MNIERLTRLAELLETPSTLRPLAVMDVGFDLTTWYREGPDYDDGIESYNECGTTACAVGHACLDVWFNAQGLVRDGGIPQFEDNSGWDAVAEFFEIDDGYTPGWLFLSDSYQGEATRFDVASRIREALALGDAGLQAKWARVEAERRELERQAGAS